jgi:hypothetical protein
MRISRPIIVLAMMAALVAGTVWLVPPQKQSMRVTVTLPVASYNNLLLWGKEHADARGKSLGVDQVIEKIVQDFRGE